MSTDPKSHQIRVYRDMAGEWRWSLRGGNGEGLGDSGEGYVRQSYAIEMATTLFPEAELVVIEDED